MRYMKTVTIVNVKGNVAGNPENRFVAVGRIGRDVVILSPGADSGTDYSMAESAALAFAREYGIRKIQLPEL